MDAELLVPATAALLDGWRGPVIIEGESPAFVWDDGGLYGLNGNHGSGLYGRFTRELRPAVRLLLDLSRAECRDRVARVLADTVTSAQGYTSGSKNGALWLGFRGPGPSWTLFGDGDLRFCAPGDEGGDGIPVPALAALDAYDTATLPDGSRLVDALALAVVAREVLRG